MQPKTVLITGCSSGIGRATALGFLQQDWRVYATARNPADIQTLGEKEGCTIAKLDVTEDDDVQRVVDRIIHESSRIDCLVNNAGYGQFGPIEDVPVDQVHRQFDVNVYGPHRLTRAVLPHMREQGKGKIINVSSVSGRISYPGSGVYAGSKFALEAMSDALRAEVDDYGIDVVLIEPGPVETSFVERAEKEIAEEGDEIPGVERSGAYQEFYDIFEDTQAIGSGGPGAVRPERVAEDIINAACSTKPEARYLVGPLARLADLGRLVPDQMRDNLYDVAAKFLTR